MKNDYLIKLIKTLEAGSTEYEMQKARDHVREAAKAIKWLMNKSKKPCCGNEKIIVVKKRCEDAVYYQLSGPYSSLDFDHVAEESSVKIAFDDYVNKDGKTWFCPIMIDCETEYKA
jgi:hypothetical protein